MRILPQSLLGRTAVVIALLLILSQAASTMLFRFYYSGLRVQHTASTILANLDNIHTALEVLPPSLQGAFLERLQAKGRIRILRGGLAPPARKPDMPFLDAVYDLIRAQYGQPLLLSKAKGQSPVVWTRLDRNGDSAWIGLPLTRLERGFPWPRIGWLLFMAMFSLLGAYWIVRRINRPLQQLEAAAAEVGRGKTAPLLGENGPTEIRAVCRAFNQMTHNVQQLDKDRKLLLAGVSHDLRTPLARLRLASAMLENHADPTLVQGMVQDIEEMDAIVGQFLNYVRDGSDEAAVHGDLNLLIKEVVGRFSRQETPVILHLGRLPRCLFRPLAMQRLLGNLLDNALRHGRPPIEIHTERVRDHLIVSVLDRGDGIPAGQCDRVTQPFARLDNVRGVAGTGLGLAIVERIALLHRGRLVLQAREGGGLAARVEIPLDG